MTEQSVKRSSIAPVIFLFSVYVLYAWDRLAVPVELIEIRRVYHLSAVAAGALASVFTLGIAAFVLVAGLIVTRLGVRPCLTGSVVLFSLSTGYTAFGHGEWDLLAARIGTGIGEAIFSVCLLAFLGGLSESRKGLMIGLAPSTYGLSSLLGPPAISAIISLTESWRAVFILLAGTGLVLAVPLALTLDGAHFREATRSHVPLSTRMRDSLSSQMLRLYIIIGASGLGAYSVLSMLVSFERSHNHVSLTMASILFSFLAFGTILGGAPLGFVGDQIGRKKVFIASTVADMVLGPLIFALPYAFALTAPLLVLFGMGIGGIYVTAFARAEEVVAPASVPLVAGLLLTVYYATAAISGPVFEQVMLTFGTAAGSLLLYALPYGIATIAASGLRSSSTSSEPIEGSVAAIGQ